MKRGEFGMVLKIVLLVATIVILLFAFVQVRDVAFFDPLNKYDCASEVLLHQKVNYFSKGNFVPSIRCPTNEVLVKKGNSDEVIKQKLANEMKWCWDTWGKGEFQLFNGTGTFCHVCSIVRFEERNRNIDGFLTYLAENNVPKQDISYFEYFSPALRGEKFDTEEFVNTLKEKGEPNLQTSNDQAVLFYYVRGPEIMNTFFGTIEQNTQVKAEAGAAGVLGGVIGGGVVIGVMTGAGLLACNVFCLTVGGAFAGISGVSTYIATEFINRVPDASASMVYVRPLTTTDVEDLGCTYSFAKAQ